MRFSLEGYELGLAERISIGQGFTLFTRRRRAWRGWTAGEIALGRLADLIVLPRDPMALKPADLMNLPVDLTIIGGRVVLRARAARDRRQPRRRPVRLSYLGPSVRQRPSRGSHGAGIAPHRPVTAAAGFQRDPFREAARQRSDRMDNAQPAAPPQRLQRGDARRPVRRAQRRPRRSRGARDGAVRARVPRSPPAAT